MPDWELIGDKLWQDGEELPYFIDAPSLVYARNAEVRVLEARIESLNEQLVNIKGDGITRA